MKITRHKSSRAQEAFYQDLCAAMKPLTEKYPSIRNIEIIAILGRLTGYCVAMCEPEARDLARATAMTNMKIASVEVASVPETATEGTMQ